MLHAAWKSLLGRKVRLMMSALSIVLGVAFVSGSLIFTNLLNDSFSQILKSALADVNVSADLQSEMTTTPVRIDRAILDEVAAVDGVAEATGLVQDSTLYPLNKDGKVLGFNGAPGIGSNWFDTPAAGGEVGARIVEGRAPEADDEIVLDPTTVERGGYAIGDQIDVSTPRNGIVTYTIVGTGTYGSGATAGAAYLFLTLPEMQRLVTDGADQYNTIWIATDPGADVPAVTSAVDALLPNGLAATSGEDLADIVEQQLSVGLSFVNTFLLVFAGIALLVATLLILNTFSILVAQRSRELAVLRALGATRRQVRNSVLFEAFVVGVVGATVGIAAGYGLAWLILVGLGAVGIDIGDVKPSLTWQAVVASYVVAIIITMLAAWWPARKASVTRPVEAMTTASVPATGVIGTGVTVGLALIPLGLAGIVCGVWLDPPKPLVWVGLGCVLLLVGCVLAAAVIGRPIVWLFGKLYRAVFGEVGRMAELNSLRQPGRTAATAATLMIGLALVSTVAILASSTTTSVRNGLTEDQRGDFLISPVGYQPFDAKVAAKAAAVAGVDRVWQFHQGQMVVGETPLVLTGTSPDGVTDGAAVEVLAGNLTEAPDSVMLSHAVSEKLDLPMGKTFSVATPDGGSVELLVTGILGEDVPYGWGDAVVNLDTYAQLADASMVSLVTVDAADGADLAAVRAGLEDTVADLPTVSVTDNAEYAESLVSQFSQIFAIIYALLALAVVISVLGIINTLGLSVMERTREIGLLRAVGMTRPQLRRMVTLESVIVAVLGSVLGVLLGIGFGAVLVRLLEDQGITQLVIPWGQLALFVVAAAIFGVLAAIGPARRAAKQDVLESIANV